MSDTQQEPDGAESPPSEGFVARLGGWLVRAALGVLVGLALVGPIASGDLFWHLRTGHWILDNGRLPQVDPFSHTAGDEPWILQEFGSQVVFAAVERAGGLAAVRAFGGLLALALLVVVWRYARRRLTPAWADFATCLFAALYALKWELRPHLISAFFAFAAVGLLFPRAALDDGQRRLPGLSSWVALAVLSCVWVQLHAEALFVPILALAGLIGAGSGLLFERTRPGNGRAVLAYGACFAASLAGTLASPLGVQPHRYALFRRSVPEQYIEEWFPAWILPGNPRFEPVSLALFALVVTGVVIAVAVQAREWLGRLAGRRNVELPRLAFLGACMVLAVKARRFFWLLWFPALHLLGDLLERVPRLRRWTPLAHALSVGLLVVLGRTHLVHGAWTALRDGRFAEHVDSTRFPTAAARVVGAAGLDGNLFHPYEWGGYLGYALGDANPVFIDGRTVLFEDVIPERWTAERDPATAARVFSERDVTVIVSRRFVERGGGWAPWRPPGADVDWIRAFGDRHTEVWLRADRADQIESLTEYWRGLGVRFDPARGFDELALLLGQPQWQAEAPVLAPAVFERLDAALLERGRRGELTPAGWISLAEQFAGLNLGRAARHGLLRGLELAGRAPAEIDATLARARGAALLSTLRTTAAELR